MKPIRLFVYLLGCITFFFGCKPKSRNVLFHFTALHLNHLDNSGAEPQPVATDSIPMKAYGIRLNLSPDIESDVKLFDPNEDKVVITNPITTISITSTDSFDLSHPPGALLNDNFVYYKGLYNVAGSIEHDSGLYPYNYFLDNYPTNYVPQYADLLLLKMPFKKRTHRFKIVLGFKDGTVLSDSTTMVKLY